MNNQATKAFLIMVVVGIYAVLIQTISARNVEKSFLRNSKIALQ